MSHSSLAAPCGEDDADDLPLEREATTPLPRLRAEAVEHALRSALGATTRHTESCPPRLRTAIEHALFPGGARLRPQLCLAVAEACAPEAWRHPEADEARLALAAASALELVHCASLVHDDLPCFDDAELRRGRPSVHRAFGQPAAVLTGDALIVLAFGHLARHGSPELSRILAEATGPFGGIIGGQAWEDEPTASVEEVHRAKTGALFAAAASMGATAVGHPDVRWRQLGETIGDAYQAADDIVDALEPSSVSGKTSGRDAALDRPSIVRELGVAAAKRRVATLLARAHEEIPPCAGADRIAAWLDALGRRLA